jgi:hypothetical protein
MSNILYNRVCTIEPPGKYRTANKLTWSATPLDPTGRIMQVSSFMGSRLPGHPRRNQVFPEPITVGEQQQEVNSSGTKARAMIGFQYTPITITYSDCIREYF